MTLFDYLRLLWHVVRWRLTWSKKDLDYKPVGQSSKFITARQAAELIPDGATVFSNGLGGNARCSVFFWAIREFFQKTGHPRQLTWINVGAQGGRGKVPGTVEEIGLPGLMACYIAGHMETCKAQLHLAENNQLELHTLPQGVMTFLLEEQARGETHRRSKVGLGTFLDPRVGEGSALTKNPKRQFIEADGDALLYNLPKIEITLINAPYADEEGNIYFRNASTWTENIESVLAAKANGGKVMVTVSQLIPKDEQQINIRANDVDHIVVHPYNEQTVCVLQRRFWHMFTEGSVVDAPRAAEHLHFINTVLKITPVRGKVEYALARMAAQVFADVVSPGAMVNIGVGFPEEAARQLVAGGLLNQLLFTTEAGAYGGLPAPGIFFSAAIGPQHLESSSTMFHRYETALDVAMLGFLQVDSAGNVNASHRGPRLIDVVGPGGFPDISHGAHTVIFIGSWMADAKFVIENQKLHLKKRGACKFVAHVTHQTFNAQEALKMGKKVFYITHVGVFELTEKGIALRQIMPGIDLERDILKATKAKILLPPEGSIKTVDSAVLSNTILKLKLKAISKPSPVL